MVVNWLRRNGSGKTMFVLLQTSKIKFPARRCSEFGTTRDRTRPCGCGIQKPFHTSGPMVRSMACQGPGIRNSTSDRRLAICGRKLRNLAMEPLPGHPCRCRLDTIRSSQGMRATPNPARAVPLRLPPSTTTPPVRPAARLRHTATMHPSVGCRPRYI